MRSVSRIVCVTVATVLIASNSVGAAPMDLTWVDIGIAYELRAGVPRSAFPWDFEIEVQAAGPSDLHHVDITKPGEVDPFTTIYGTDDPGDEYEWQFNPPQHASLADLRANYPEGVYTLHLRDSSNALLRTIEIDSSGVPLPTEAATFTYPSVDGQTGVSTNPTFTWTLDPEAGDAHSMALEIMPSEEEVAAAGRWFPTTVLSWSPGPLLPYQEYMLWSDVRSVKGWTPEGWPMTTIDGDEFVALAQITFDNEIYFTTGVIPAPAVLALAALGTGLVGWLRRRGAL